MKRNILICFLILLALSARGQYDSSGIYLSVDDYRNGKLALAVSCQNKQELKIKLNDRFGSKPYITVKRGGSESLFDKLKIFRYVDCKKGVSRFFNGDDNQMVNSKDIFLYVRKKTVSEGKGGFTIVTDCYFSVTDKDSILKLTRHDLKNAYSENRKFREGLDRFDNDKALTAYDKPHKSYLLVEVFEEPTAEILNSNSSDFFLHRSN